MGRALEGTGRVLEWRILAGDEVNCRMKRFMEEGYVCVGDGEILAITGLGRIWELG